MEQLIEKYTHTAQGYCPSLIREGWQVAFLNYAPAEALESIVKLDIHHHTDEVFVLLSGHAVLIAATISPEGEIEYDLIDMLPEVIYNIPQDTWHKIAMQPGSKVCIVERDRTHISDFEFYDLSEVQQQDLQRQVNSIL